MKSSSLAKRQRTSGMSLIEILVAVTILATFLLPVYGLYMMNTRNRDYIRAWSNAIDISSNIMERLLSEDVPFLAIDPEGYISDVGEDTKAILANGRVQADFRDSFGALNFQNYNLKSILGASKGGDYRVDAVGDRIITKGGIDFKILLWAGIYADEPASPSPAADLSYKHNADPTREMTFSYYPNPWFDILNTYPGLAPLKREDFTKGLRSPFGSLDEALAIVRPSGAAFAFFFCFFFDDLLCMVSFLSL